jgi:hypothetical protein
MVCEDQGKCTGNDENCGGLGGQKGEMAATFSASKSLQGAIP